MAGLNFPPASVRPSGPGIVCVQRYPIPSQDVAFCLTMGMVFWMPKKNERPVGGPAARAWGWRIVIRSQFGFPAALLRSHAAGRHTGARNSLALYCSRKPKQLPTTCVVCSSMDSPSIARWVHSFQYFPLPAPQSFWYGSTSRLDAFHDHPLLFPYARFVASVEHPLFDPLGPHKPGSRTMWIL